MTYYSMENLLETSRRVIAEERLNEALITCVDFGYLPSLKHKFHRVKMMNGIWCITFNNDGSRMRLDISKGINKIVLDLRSKDMTQIDIATLLDTSTSNVSRIIIANNKKNNTTKGRKRR